MTQDYREILNLSREASDSEIHQTYRQQLRIWRNRQVAKDPQRRREAKRRLTELAAIERALPGSRNYSSNKAKPKKKSTKKPIQRKRRQSSGTVDVGLRIVSNGSFSAISHILRIVGTVAGTIGRIILRILVIILVGVSLISGIGGAIAFALGIYEQSLNQAFQGMVCNYLFMSIVAFAFYFWDKRAARLGNWRVPEKRLHRLELAGGWIGAFLGQIFLRHKSSKASYQLVYWLIVFFHLSLLLFFIPPSFPFAIPRNIVLIINAFLLIISLHSIQNK